MEAPKKLNVLFLPAWYPNRNDSMLGLFVQRHAIAVSEFANVSVLAVISDEKAAQLYQIESHVQDGITEILIYTKKCQTSFGIINTFVNAYRYITAHIAGWKILEQTDSKPDINHVHILTRAGIMALFFKIRYKIPFVITEHWSRYLPYHQGGYSGAIRKKMTKKVLKASAGISTVSKALQSGMNTIGLIHPNWKIIPNVVNTKLFQSNDSNNNSDIIRISHISCFEEKSKNMSGILRAAKALKDLGREFELVMIGNGPDWEETKRYAIELNLGNSIRFTDVLEGDDLVDEMSRCHFSVLFSNYETFAIVIPENLSLGIPVIATDVGGIPEVLPLEYGKLIPPKDEAALSEAMAFMMDHYTEYDTDAMRNYVEENYSYDEVGKLFYKMYEEAIG
jgi:glycosyltransferase involved in cell wall biosynthesis